MSAILTFSELQRIFRPAGPPPRAATLRRWADREGIRYRYDGSGGIWTTVDAVNAALGIGAAGRGADGEKPEELI